MSKLDPESTLEERIEGVMNSLWYGLRDPISEGLKEPINCVDVFELYNIALRRALNNEPDPRRDHSIETSRRLAAMPKGLSFSQMLEHMHGNQPVKIPNADALRKLFKFPEVTSGAEPFTYPATQQGPER